MNIVLENLIWFVVWRVVLDKLLRLHFSEVIINSARLCKSVPEENRIWFTEMLGFLNYKYNWYLSLENVKLYIILNVKQYTLIHL